MSYPFRVTDATVDVVEALLSGDDELYGLKIAKSIGRPSGSVVPILMRLEACGWVLSEWEQDESVRGPRRRFYRLHADHVGAARRLVGERKTASATAVSSTLRPGLGGVR
ncbi:helix-turn-helix transcriptional regulator [Streptomyces sp. NPDC088788]|uniref:helix-turn-helix transcriptional regulator n=1 Tax=Streptomyces sp. NPDC088788 TaxID=3365898 RepID=UPI003803179B